MIGSVSIHQPSLGLRDLQRLYQPAQQPAVRPAQPSQAEVQTQLQVNDTTQFSTRQGRVPAAMVKLFDDAPHAAGTGAAMAHRVAEGGAVRSHISQAAPAHHVTRTQHEHSRVATEQQINPQAFAAEQGSRSGNYHAASHILANQSTQRQEQSAHATSNKHNMHKAQQYHQNQQLKPMPRPAAPAPAAAPQQPTLLQDMGRFIKDVFVPGSAKPAQSAKPAAARPATVGRLSIVA